jgi:hypothetical protein
VTDRDGLDVIPKRQKAKCKETKADLVRCLVQKTMRKSADDDFEKGKQ